MQGCGSAFIWSGSGSSILGWIPIRIQGFVDHKLEKIYSFKNKKSNPDPDPLTRFNLDPIRIRISNPGLMIIHLYSEKYFFLSCKSLPIGLEHLRDDILLDFAGHEKGWLAQSAILRIAPHINARSRRLLTLLPHKLKGESLVLWRQDRILPLEITDRSSVTLFPLKRGLHNDRSVLLWGCEWKAKGLMPLAADFSAQG